MKFIIMTDLEGVVGVDHFSQTRTTELSEKINGMKQLAREVNACVQGILSVHKEATVDVIDGHGTGGLLEEDLMDCRYISLRGNRTHRLLKDYDALLFVGQHAMAGTIDAPLCHTYSSKEVLYYRLNEVFIGEFAGVALIAGIKGIPTIFLSGDDKAVAEAKMFIPELETVTTKWGTGLESAKHRDAGEVCEEIRNGAANAVRRLEDFSPYRRLTAPFRFEARHYHKLQREKFANNPLIQFVDDYSYRLETMEISELPL